MKKIISQISLILLIMIIGTVSVFVSKVYAADSMAGINCTSTVEKGKDFTVSLIIPETNAFGIQADIEVMYSNGTTETKTIIFMGEYGDKSVTFNAKVAGKATVTAKNIIITDENTNVLEQGKTKVHSMTVTEKKVDPPQTNSGESSGAGNTNTANNTTNNNGTTNTATNTTTNNEPKEPKFKDVNETVYTTTRCNIRKSYSSSSDKIATVEKNSKLTRKGIGDNGWSKVEYNGKTAYIYTEYLTTTVPEEPEVVFKDTNENLYAKQNCNLRKSWSTDSEKVGYLMKGQAVERTGYADNGWSRIKYNGNIVYVASRLLVVEKPEDEETNTTNTTDTANTVNNNIVNNEIIEESTELTEEEKLNQIKEEIGVLPEVGNNIANVIYIILTILAIIGVLTGVYYIKKIR